MNDIDNRIVRMEFQNSKFESGVQTSLSTIEKLKSALAFTDAKAGFAEIEDAASKGLSLGPISTAVDKIADKFSMLSIIGITALQNITNRAITTGETLIKSLSSDQIAAGFAKYGSKTQSVQTIMNATGESMDSVSESLDRLNWFTDETSYNFTDMVSNIGKFTSQGVKLDTAVDAMQGIATWAGLSGATVQQASQAMYNLSQMMGVGHMMAIDWRSIENAQMATMEFKEMVIENAYSMGTLKKVADGVYKTLEGNEVTVTNFRDAFRDGWFTADVLI